MKAQRGFTLIELAIVVVLIGMMVGGGLFAVGPLILQAKLNQTNQNLDQIEASLVLFAIRTGRLPCPADGSLANTNANYGIEPSPTPTNGGSCTTTLTNSVIPWKTMGLDENYSVDGWNNRISYYPANGAITGVQTLVDNSFGATRACTADGTGATCSLCLARTTSTTSSSRASLCDVATANLTPSYPYGNYIAVYSIDSTNVVCSTELSEPNTNQASATPGPYTGTDNCTSVSAATSPITTNLAPFDGLRAAYVLISHGPSGWYAWPKGGGTQRLPPGGTTYQLKKYNSGVIGNLAGSAPNLGFVQGPALGTAAYAQPNYFDDILRWRSPAYIIQNCGSASCGNP